MVPDSNIHTKPAWDKVKRSGAINNYTFAVSHILWSTPDLTEVPSGDRIVEILCK
jgi:hypothetical protein